MHDPLPIASADLADVVLREYGRAAEAITFLPLGMDTRAGLYRVECGAGEALLLKVKGGAFYEASGRAPRHLRDQGIAAVVAPLPTRTGALWTTLGEWTLLLYPFIRGVSRSQPPLTDGQWAAVGAATARIHAASLPTDEDLGLRRETFDPTPYRRWAEDVAAKRDDAGQDALGKMLHARWQQHAAAIAEGLDALDRLGAALRAAPPPFVVCHADLHWGNIIRAGDDVHLVDWDDVRLAPKERDFLFVGEPPSARDQQSGAPFFRGYGATAIDWSALIYFRWERIIQDLLEESHIACERDDLSAAVRAEAVERFSRVFAPGGMADAVRSAARYVAE